MKILVIGAGIGGLGAATALRQGGHAVDVVEVKPDSSVLGVGLSQQANGLRALRSLGVLDEVRAAGYAYDHADFFDADGELIVRCPSAFGDAETPARVSLSRTALHQILIGATERHGVKIRYSTSVESFTDHGDIVEVAFSDARVERYDLVVAFDGIRSATRRRLFGLAYEPAYSGFGVFRVPLPRPAELTAARVYQAPGVKAGFMPLTATASYMYLVSGDPAGTVHESAQLYRVMRERMEPFAAGTLPGRAREALGPQTLHAVWSAISDVTLPLPWFRGRVGVLGDAAHACAPHLAQGASMAMEDAVVLGEELSREGPLEEQLERFQQRRFPRAKFVQDVSHAILDAEMKIDEADYRAAYAEMRQHLPEQTVQTERWLNELA